MIAGEIPDLVGYLDIKSLKVHSPAPALFVCGGPTDIKDPLPRSLRDAFMRIQDRLPFSKYLAILAEELNAFFPEGDYKDILSLEIDIAQICELIVLFSESYGSAAELGAFSMTDEISLRLLVVMDDLHYDAPSFLTLGPVRSLRNLYGESSVYVLHRDDVGITSIHNAQSINLDTFAARMSSAITARIQRVGDRSTFDPKRNGHVIKLMVGLIQHYGALTIIEIDVLLYCLEIKKGIAEVSNLLLCAVFLKWIIREKRGSYVYYVSIVEKEAMAYRALPGVIILDKIRWRADIVDHWKRSEPDRFNSIRSARTKVAS